MRGNLHQARSGHQGGHRREGEVATRQIPDRGALSAVKEIWLKRERREAPGPHSPVPHGAEVVLLCDQLGLPVHDHLRSEG